MFVFLKICIFDCFCNSDYSYETEEKILITRTGKTATFLIVVVVHSVLGMAKSRTINHDLSNCFSGESVG